MKTLRESRGISVGRLASEASVSWGTLSGLESGAVAPDLATVEQLADALNSTIDELVGRVTFRRAIILCYGFGMAESEIAMRAFADSWPRPILHFDLSEIATVSSREQRATIGTIVCNVTPHEGGEIDRAQRLIDNWRTQHIIFVAEGRVTLEDSQSDLATALAMKSRFRYTYPIPNADGIEHLVDILLRFNPDGSFTVQKWPIAATTPSRRFVGERFPAGDAEWVLAHLVRGPAG